MNDQSIFIYTEAFFHNKKELLELTKSDYQLFTNNLVIYEFVDVIIQELELAKNSQNDHRVKVLTNLRDRFPQLIIDLKVVIKDFTLTNEILLNVYDLMAKYKMNISDIFHLLTIKEHDIQFILSKDGDWERAEGLVKIFE